MFTRTVTLILLSALLMAVLAKPPFFPPSHNKKPTAVSLNNKPALRQFDIRRAPTQKRNVASPSQVFNAGSDA
ncbi:hypothetical protein BDZ97DRAFT_1862728 [Flammula alnicola]|nr:hypothetical protein BDZ97DRAFT_1862728 [Flammula alnicola]